MFDLNLEFARGGAAFATELLNQLLADGSSTQNIIFSPFSIQACMALAFAGAQGATADEIAKALRYVSNSPPEVGETFQFVFNKYQNSPLLRIANKIYVKENHRLKTCYQNALKNYYYSEAESINFKENVVAANAINNWVNEKTAGKIKKLISADCLNDETQLVLLNALHFKGNWVQKFNESLTAEDDFWTSENDAIKVKYMNQKAKFNMGYFEDLECSIIEMPYTDSDLSMMVLLPLERTGLKALTAKLQNINLIDLIDRMSVEEVQVKFPKFKIDYSVELNNKLKTFGVNKMFTKDAEFTNMLEAPKSILVSKVLHRSCIEVNEEGTEAAAATGIIMMTRMLLPEQFIADHPFLYFVWNRKNILFAGTFVTAPPVE